jgi:hypothetical protein
LFNGSVAGNVCDASTFRIAPKLVHKVLLFQDEWTREDSANELYPDSPTDRPRQRRLTKISEEVSKVSDSMEQHTDKRSSAVSSEVVGTRARVMRSDKDMEDRPSQLRPREDERDAPKKRRAKTLKPPRDLKTAVRNQLRSDGIPYTPEALTEKELLQAGYGTATPVGKNFAGLYADRLAMVDPSFAAPSLRSEAQITRKKVCGQALMTVPKANQWKDGVPKAKEATRNELVSRLVKGNIWDESNLSGETKKEWIGKAPWLDTTLKSLIMNGSYTKRDVEDFKDRILKLLPGSPAAAKPTSKAAPAAA